MRLYLIGAVGVALMTVGGFLYFSGVSHEKTRSNLREAADELEDATEYRHTRERIDDANSVDRTPGDVLERLRRHAQ